MRDDNERSAVGGMIFWAAAAAVVCGVFSSAVCLRFERVGQNEAAIRTTNGVITEDHLQPGLQWNWSLFDKIEYPRVSLTTQLTTITAVDKGQQCDQDCVTLQTADQQTVTGSLGIQWHVERNSDSSQSVIAELYNLRGATTTQDIQEKFLLPRFTDCLISNINKVTAASLIDAGDTFKNSVKACATPRVAAYHIVIEDVFDRGFGPSPEARISMRRFADARQDGQVADIQMQTAEKRKAAALKNAEIFSAAYGLFIKNGLTPNQALTASCLVDGNSKERPCVPYTAMGGASSGAVFATPAATPSGPALQ